MLLTYRGVSYQRNSSKVQMSETNIFGIYRSIPYCLHRATLSRNDRSFKNLTYRGISYSTKRSTSITINARR